ncbi:hypothetical protein [Ralstonia pickettii]|uniref:hypothetical protein n=1 Tax=Ralstonia pickettii TaxID=329 RepID=UPI000AED62BC
MLAALTCPRHLPLLSAVLASTSVGAFIGDHPGVAAVALLGLFLLVQLQIDLALQAAMVLNDLPFLVVELASRGRVAPLRT